MLMGPLRTTRACEGLFLAPLGCRMLWGLSKTAQYWASWGFLWLVIGAYRGYSLDLQSQLSIPAMTILGQRAESPRLRSTVRMLGGVQEAREPLTLLTSGPYLVAQLT